MRILVLDDDARLRAELASFLTLNGHGVLQAASLSEARALLGIQSETEAEGSVDLVLADLYLGMERGTDLLADAATTPIVMISGAGGIREAVDALKAGAWDFLEKPVDPDRLLGLLRNLDRGLNAERGMAAMRKTWLAEHAAFAPGSPFEAAMIDAGRVAVSPLSVLVTGPSGSGKEVVARWIHYRSPRSGGPFVAVNCAAVSPELAESAFFGARRGAYTGADTDRAGWFQAADGGTLFLDELGEIPLALQAKLLRAVECGEVQRVGATSVERVSLRIVSATNRDLTREIAAGRFREDLYWRLAQTSVRVPPLCERPRDVALLALFFLAKAQGAGATGNRFSPEALAWLEARAWPGNVRELRALVEKAAWLANGEQISAAELASLEEIGRSRSPGQTTRPSLAANFPLDPSPRGFIEEAAEKAILTLKEAKEAFERAYVERTLSEFDGSVSKAALALDILPNNLSRKIKELGLRLDKDEKKEPPLNN